MWRVARELETAVREATAATLGADRLATATLTRAIVDRSLRYTSERDRLAAPRDPDGDLAARAAFFTIADAAKIALPIAELESRDALPARRPLRVTDVGAGCGAMSLGLTAALPGVALEVTAIDRDTRALTIARRALAALGVASVDTRGSDVASCELPPADLVVLGTVLNELAREPALALIERALATIADDGAVIAIEPALRETSRALHAVRDAVIERGTGHVFAPCTRRCAPCPALADPRDWCHEDRPLELPPTTAELARLTHLRDGGMKMSYLVLRRAPKGQVVAGSGAWRVVSAPRIAKGKHEVIGCSERGRVTLRLLKRNRAPANRVLEDARRGDVLELTGDATDTGDRIEITRDTHVVRTDVHRP